MTQERPVIDSPLLEVAEILALGILRLRTPRMQGREKKRQVPLDLCASKSVGVTTTNQSQENQ